MTLARLVAVIGLCALALAVPGTTAQALSCPSNPSFASKVKNSPIVVFGTLTKIAGKKYHVDLVKVVKGKTLVGAKKTVVFDHSVPRMGSGFGFKPKTGQLILFFLQADARDWLCTSPILIR